MKPRQPFPRFTDPDLKLIWMTAFACYSATHNGAIPSSYRADAAKYAADCAVEDFIMVRKSKIK
jgi:hypothetical protein